MFSEETAAAKKAIGARLRQVREAPPRWSRPDLARLLRDAADPRDRACMPHVKPLAEMIKHWENGKHVPGDRYRPLHSRVTGMSEAELFEAPAPIRVTVAGRAAHFGPRVGHYGPVAPELVGYFRQQLPGHYAADMWLGPYMLIPTVDAQTRLIQQLLPTAEPRVRRGLHEMGVAYAALLGWLYQDAAELSQSEQWRSVALDMAHRSGDPQLVSYALSNKAMHAVDCGDGAAVIDYAQAALADGPRLVPKLRILALVHLAHGYAFTGRRADAERELDRAEALIGQIDDEYPWGNACRRTPRYIEIQRATAYGRTGHYADASGLWDEILGDQPENYRRDTGVFWARQAAALAGSQAPEPEKVVQIASIAAAACEETGSRRLRRELMAVPEHASVWSHSPHGRQLAEIIATVDLDRPGR
ncbi:hypothetical protein ACFHW2_43270 [Actinomadura sp. LOL_016]|uniref:hypothetical protein n=1 Tax=unclassified Actinomadura TaxID=2626254 RepID=UPI003A8116AF